MPFLRVSYSGRALWRKRHLRGPWEQERAWIAGNWREWSVGFTWRQQDLGVEVGCGVHGSGKWHGEMKLAYPQLWRKIWWPGGALEGRGQLWGRQHGGRALCPGQILVSGLEASLVLTVWPLVTAAHRPAGTWLWPESGASHAPSPGSRGPLLISVQAAPCCLLPAPTVMDRGSYRKETVTTIARLCGCCSVAKSCPTLCSPMDCGTPGFPVHHLPKSAQIHVHWVGDAIQPSHPLSYPCPAAFNLSQHQSFPMSWLFVSSGQNIGASALVLPMNIEGWFPLGLTGLISLLSRDSQESSPVLQLAVW